ncbi:Delta(3,5)-Delta(2,4)-dienoyl-CoA isomerase, mitochondrial [Colletotrichum chlorophyti]|uniref:Delta(3,5)-Delta(2,4)-dienoyl-CoA isomerase, mitochondrial n=1 Tax=Colletotrichum chlorophyti TaxID=708187 RepID=A0A1Q8RNU2_9PEZI|nr:Delta(3,5)-Delta(2,4)-dienoyl-CoA isomerase, mitochondrial [Colletotrichum chlorophyti]
MATFKDYTYTHFLVTSPTPFVVHVQINRPQKLNAFSEPVWREFEAVFNRLSSDPDVRAVVLSGAGDRAFSAGLDVQDASTRIPGMGQGDPSRHATVMRRYILEFQRAVSSAEKCEKPVICVMHGISIGIAINLSCSADVRICARDTRFAVKEVDIGLAADIGALSRLPKLVGSTSWVKDVCLTARDFFADEALAVGFVSQVHETKDAAINAGLRLAGFIASKSPVAVQGTKELLNHARDHPVEENLRYTSVWNSAMLQSSDFKAALTSGLTKKKPTFEKL